MFSIIICTYNGGNRLSRVLDSILYQKDFDLLVDEILVVDNCSTDCTAKLINEYKVKNKRIKYLYEMQQGLSYARLGGVKNALSPWIIFLDDDNFLEQNWISNAATYIESHPTIGAFNGKIVPRFFTELTDKQKQLLQVSYLGLACTTYSEDVDIHINEKSWIPFGAGLVILSAPLKKMAKIGWLKSEGRKKDKIISGEDTEMVYGVKRQGYLFGFCNDMTLYHEIGIQRLELKYLEQLYNSFGVANYIGISNKELKTLRKIKWAIIEGFKWLQGIIYINWKPKESFLFYKYKLNVCRANGYYNSLFNMNKRK